MTFTLDYTDHKLLFGRIVFRVDAADFTLKGDEAAPLVDFSFVLRTVVDSLSDGDLESYESPTAWARITFARSSDQVAISASFTDATATVALSELRDATAAFHARVMQDLEIRYPKLVDNPAAQKFFVSAPAPGA
jgi:hypothetical protein